MTDRLRPGLPQPDLPVEANRALLAWHDHLLAGRPAAENLAIRLTGRLSLISGLRLWSLCEQNLPFWTDITVGQVLSGETILELRDLVEIAGQIPRPPRLELLVDRLADEIVQVGGAGHSVAVRGSGGYLRQLDQGSPAVTASSLRGIFKTQKSLQLEFFMATTTKTPSLGGLIERTL